MSDVVRHVRSIQEVAYTVGPDTVRRAITCLLYDENGGAFTPDTTFEFHDDGSVTVTTAYPLEDDEEAQS